MNQDRPRCAHPGCTNLARRKGFCETHGEYRPKSRAAHRAGELAPRRETVSRPLSPELTPTEHVTLDRDRQQAATRYQGLNARYQEALKTIERQDGELRSLNVLGQGVEKFSITPCEGSGTSEATPVIVASDWHVEELVGTEIGGLNVYNPDIAKRRAEEFFQRSLRLMRLLNRDVKIHTVVLALLGDFITGNIHGEENAEKNDLTPNHAIVFAQNLIISGIEFLLEHTKYRFVIPCHSGNHARTTQKTRFGAENGHSLEFLMYLHLAAYFRTEKRLTFIIPEGYHSYLDVLGTTIRFHHGHAVKYGGGVGGIYIPTNKKIAQWQKGRHADLDVFGHFHQLIDGGNFICNGSLIGFNSFALAIGASYELPKQALFLIDKKRGRTFTMPILFNQ